MLSVYDEIQQRRVAQDAVRRSTERQRKLFTRARKVDEKYALALRKIARHIGEIIKMFPPDDPQSAYEINRVLHQYANILDPWARRMAKKVLAEVAHWDEYAWRQHSKSIRGGIAKELESAETGFLFHRLQEEQVRLITSIPREAAERVHELTQKALADSSRAKSLAEEIMRSGSVAESRANTIARTEVARATTSFTQARALHLGSTHYRWRTSRDSRVRSSHNKMEGKIIAWSDPPTIDNMTGHAGQFPNCRCYPEVIFNED